MTNNQIHTSESQLQQRCADLEKDNARLLEKTKKLEMVVETATDIFQYMQEISDDALFIARERAKAWLAHEKAVAEIKRLTDEIKERVRLLE